MQVKPVESLKLPGVWLVSAYRAGEQSQLRALAEALGWPCEEKTLSYRKMAIRTNLFRGSDLRGINRDKSSPLSAPWPDLIISAGMRNEPVCRWIRHQSKGHSRIVHLGRPWADPERFDLVITTPQYRLPVRDNVLQNILPLNGVNTQSLSLARQQWESAFRNLPRPLIAVIAGGDSGPYTFGRKAAKRLAGHATRMAREREGSLLITTSARTRGEAADQLATIDSVPVHFYRWQPNDRANPYFAYLAMADEIIVTADSISMLSEACATEKPVWMFDLGEGQNSMSGKSEDKSEGNDFRLSGLAYRALMRWGWQRLSRDITLVHRRLLDSGQAAWLGDKPPQKQHGSAGHDLKLAVARIREMMGPGNPDDLSQERC